MSARLAEAAWRLLAAVERHGPGSREARDAAAWFAWYAGEAVGGAGPVPATLSVGVGTWEFTARLGADGMAWQVWAENAGRPAVRLWEA